jgi:Protein of unknown function (DUF4239)
VNIGLAVAIVAVATAAAIGALLWLRRRAPDGGYYHDPDRAAGVFGVLGASFAVLLAFVIFLSFEDYDNAKAAAEDEALAVLEQFEAAELFAPTDRDVLQGELVCYGRAVVEDEWPLMADNERSELVDRWVFTLDRTFDASQPRGYPARVAFDKWFDETTQGGKGRTTRLLEASGPIPSPMWFVLLLGAAIVVGYMLFWADSGERRKAQAMQIGAVTAVVTTGLLIVRFLDNPYEDSAGSIKPEAMRATVVQLQELEHSRHPLAAPPCDDTGEPRPGAVRP